MFTAKQSAKFKKEVGKRLRDEITSMFGERCENVFASRIGISQGSLSDILNGHSSPSARTLFLITTYSRINIRWLLTGIE